MLLCCDLLCSVIARCVCGLGSVYVGGFGYIYTINQLRDALQIHDSNQHTSLPRLETSGVAGFLRGVLSGAPLATMDLQISSQPMTNWTNWSTTTFLLLQGLLGNISVAGWPLAVSLQGMPHICNGFMWCNYVRHTMLPCDMSCI